MLPLCTSVTLSYFWAIAYSMAARISRFEPSSEIGLMPMPLRGREADGLDAHLLLEELDHPAGLGGAGLVLDAGVDVLGVLAEDHHVHLLGCLHRRGHAR